MVRCLGHGTPIVRGRCIIRNRLFMFLEECKNEKVTLGLVPLLFIRHRASPRIPLLSCLYPNR
jgi:hypothetical protein